MRKRLVGSIVSVALVLIGITGVPAAKAAYPGFNGKIAFVSAAGTGFGIFTVNVDGTQRTQLTESGDVTAEPAWSPDGMKIAYANRSFAPGIWTMNADGTDKHRLNEDGDDPTWSPDGKQIAFIAGAFQAQNIYIMNADGTGRHRLTIGGNDAGPAWSPNGLFIAYSHANDPSLPTDIYSISVNGPSRPRNLTQSYVGQVQPNWSPDGTKIAFISLRDTGNELYVMSSDGDAQTRLTETPIDYELHPAWSPDGNRILVSIYLTGAHQQLYSLSTDGSQISRVTHDDFNDSEADWQPLQCNLKPIACVNQSTRGALLGPVVRLIRQTLNQQKPQRAGVARGGRQEI